MSAYIYIAIHVSMLTALSIIIITYCVLLLFVLHGWLRMNAERKSKKEDETFISVIVPARNEEANIIRLLDSLVTQDYSSFEIIVVDDHSDDRTEQLIRDFNSPFVKCIQNQGSGKKHSISSGVAIANGEIIVTTDADCECHPGWLNAINRAFEKDIPFAFGPVTLEGEGTVFSHLQQLEHASLTATSGATMYYQFPTMCSGANLAFKKDAFVHVNGYEGNVEIPSGDDEFLMRKMAKEFPGRLRYIAGANSIVKTKPTATIGELIQQRLRWAAKWRFNSSAGTIAIALFVILVQLASIACFIQFLITGKVVYMLLITCRFIFELILLIAFCRYLRLRFRLWEFFLLFLIYPFYSLFIGIASNFTGYEWKKRRYGRRG